MKISVVSSVFVNYRLLDTIDQIHQLGVDGVDLWCGRPHTYRKDFSKEMLLEVKNRLAKANLSPVSLMPAFAHYPYSLSSPVEIIRQDSVAYMKDTIDNAAVIGAPYVLVVPKPSLYGQPLMDSQERFMDSLDIVSKYAKSKDISLAIEIVYPKLSDHMGLTKDAIEMITMLGHDNLGVAIDSGHLNLSGEDVEKTIQDLGDLLLQVHINDNNQKQQQNAIPGEGNFNFSEFLGQLEKHHYNGFLSIELSWAYSFDPIPALKKSINHLKTFL